MPAARDFWGLAFWSALGAVLLPALLVSTIWNGGGWAPSSARQNAILSGAIALAGVAWVARLSPDLPGGRRDTATLLVAWGATLLCLAIGWSKLFEAAHFSGVTGHIFRKVFLGYWAPFYGRGRDPDGAWMALAVLAAAALVAVIVRGARELPVHLLVWVLAGTQLALVVAIAGSEDVARVFRSTHAHATFSDYASGFASPLDLLRGWTEAMPGFEGFARHYPPGLSLVSAIVGPSAAKLVFLAMPSLGLWAVAGIARELALEDAPTRAALFVYATSAPVAVFPSITPTPSLLLVGAVCVWLLLHALRTGSLAAACAMGLGMASFALCSFAVYLVVLPMGCLVLGAVVAGRCAAARAFKVVGASLAVFVSLFVLLYLATGFDLVACLRQANRTTIVAFVPNAEAFALRVSGGLLAHAVTAGPMLVLAVAATSVLRSQNRRSWAGVFCLSMVAGYLLGGLSGRSYLETERVFVIYAPLLAIPAGVALALRADREGPSATVATVVIGLGLTLAWGLFVQHHFSPGG